MRSRKNRTGRLALALVLVGLLLFTSGCGAAKALSQLKDRFAGTEPPVPEAPKTGDLAQAPEQGIEPGQTIKVMLYFADPRGETLVAEERIIPKVVGIGRETIEELINGPNPLSGLQPTIPEGTFLNDINIRPDGLAIVDFSRELVTNLVGGSAAEELAVYSIVNTLTQFPSVQKVQLRIDGQNVKTIGSLDVSAAMTRDESIISSFK